MQRSYLSIRADEVLSSSETALFGELAAKLPFAVEPTQSAAWKYQLRHLQDLARGLPSAHFLLEFLIPRMGRRADLVIVQAGLVFVVEYKLGARQFDRSSLDQVYGYGLDLKHFHETSHAVPIVPILVATEADDPDGAGCRWDEDGLAHPLKATPANLSGLVNSLSRIWGEGDQVDPLAWEAGRYRPTPTIIEAAQALYRGHKVEEISRSEAGAENLSKTADYVARVIEDAKSHNHKAICFISGVPGSGKTLAGLNLATARQRAHCEEHAVFLSGNGPLVTVLREALALDAVASAKASGQPTSKARELRGASAFIQNIHHFRDEALASQDAPIEKVAVFDEAQRAWDRDQTIKFMKQKRGQTDFAMSEPEFLLSVMDRHQDWCVIVCLVGGGQEINTGEAGIEEWLAAISSSFQHWQAHLPPGLGVDAPKATIARSDELHLATSVRSFRAENLSQFIGTLLEGQTDQAAAIADTLTDYPLFVTRDLSTARSWLRKRKRGQERAGILAHSNAIRLKPEGIFVKAKVEPANWILGEETDIRSSGALEDVATEFDVQGLELDWACVCWDANLRWNGKWQAHRFRGSRWENVNDEASQRYLINSYRVLLTRARQGMVVFVPEGSTDDVTRDPNLYNAIYSTLRASGLDDLDESSE